MEAALADPAKSPRELAWQFTDRERHFLSESSVYRILKAEDLITSPAYVVLSAAKTFAHPTHRPNELWQTDFTYLQVVGWGRKLPRQVDTAKRDCPAVVGLGRNVRGGTRPRLSCGRSSL